MFYQIFLSPQVKRYAIITFIHGIYELPQDLPHFTQKPEPVSNIKWMIVSGNIFLPLTLAPDPLKLNFLDHFGNSKTFHTALAQY